MNITYSLNESEKRITTENNEILKKELKFLRDLIADNYEIPEKFKATTLEKRIIKFNKQEFYYSQKAIRILNKRYEFNKMYMDGNLSVKEIFYAVNLSVRHRLIARTFRNHGKTLKILVEDLENFNYPNNVVKSINPRIVKFLISNLLLKIANFLFSPQSIKLVFNPITVDWQEEYFEALFKKEKWKARWINVRYTYAFLGAMWQKSPIGDLIEFVRKIAK